MDKIITRIIIKSAHAVLSIVDKEINGKEGKLEKDIQEDGNKHNDSDQRRDTAEDDTELFI